MPTNAKRPSGNRKADAALLKTKRRRKLEDKGVYVFTWKDGSESHVDDAADELEAIRKSGRAREDITEWMWYTSDEYEMEFGGIQR